MPPKKRVAQPIDRPLSKAYLRGFTGWSTAYPPGASDPASLRVMDNVWVDRNGSVAVRPGLRYLSYRFIAPDSPANPEGWGLALPTGDGITMVGGAELFYVADGSRALLFAVRETDDTVGFRALLLSSANQAVYELDAPQIGFSIPFGESTLRFSSETRYVKYLQINNKILALSDAGEPARYFDVGSRKIAKALNTISVPEWLTQHKAVVAHPNATWINERNGFYEAFNSLKNPAFSGDIIEWTVTGRGKATIVNNHLKVETLPSRTNLVANPLKNPSASIASWFEDPDAPATLAVAGLRLQLTASAAGPFRVRSRKMDYGLESGELYRVALDYVTAASQPSLTVEFYTIDNAKVDATLTIPLPSAPTEDRFVSDPIVVPEGAVAMRVGYGAVAAATGGTAQIRNVLVCQADENTNTTFDGETAGTYFWRGAAYNSASTYHPDTALTLTSEYLPATVGEKVYASIDAYYQGAGTQTVTVQAWTRDAYGITTTESSSGIVLTPAVTQRLEVEDPDASYATAAIRVRCGTLSAGEYINFDRALLCSTYIATNPGYFDGSLADTTSYVYSWEDGTKPHASRSRRAYLWSSPPALVAETPTANTLIKSGGSAQNPYKMAFFYTFENETGESAPSQITEVRMQRPWSNWYWETPNSAGEPSGTATTDPFLCCDQLAVTLPSNVYNQAVAEGALKWHLYAMSWSDQSPVPVEADLVSTGVIRSTPDADPAPLTIGRTLVVTPRKLVTSYALNLPTRDNRTNYSEAPRHRNGLVAGERIIMVGDPGNPAAIQWTSRSPANSLNFTPTKGGGVKTLATGNLNIPVDVALWQNPQSVDTLTILCNGDDGESIAYYMSPANVTQGQSGSQQIMGFEQVTNTPGSEAVYGSEVMNNALYRPVDHGLLKSTANNYSLKHKLVTDDIANSWLDLRGKSMIVSAQLDGRLYLLVNNGRGALLEPGCRGNEIWVYDTASEAGSWSRFTVQAHSLKVFTLGNRARMGVLRPDGMYYFDPFYRKDDYVGPVEEGSCIVYQRPIQWYLETNTQGANRAHDAWCHLQQVVPTLGNFQGAIRYGIKAQSIDGKWIEREKLFRDNRPFEHEKATWDVQDALQVRRDMMEWRFYAGSVEGEYSHGQLQAVQYRYTPVSVNVGYEYGSVETYEYGRNAQRTPDTYSDNYGEYRQNGPNGPTVYSDNGIPTPYMDYTRP